MTGISPAKITMPLNNAPSKVEVTIGALAAGLGLGGLRSTVPSWLFASTGAARETAPVDNTAEAHKTANIRVPVANRVPVAIRLLFRV